MATPISPQVQLEKTYNAAADHYDHPSVSFWDRFGRRTIERLPITPGMNVLDVCCGMGGSALPAAERVRSCGGRRSRAKSLEQRNQTSCEARHDKHRIPPCRPRGSSL